MECINKEGDGVYNSGSSRGRLKTEKRWAARAAGVREGERERENTEEREGFT